MDVGLLCGYARCSRSPSAVGDDPSQLSVDRLVNAYERHRPVDRERVLYFETEFLASVLVDMTDRYIRRCAGESVAANPLLDEPGMAAVIRARLKAVTGIPVPTPEEAAV